MSMRYFFTITVAYFWFSLLRTHFIQPTFHFHDYTNSTTYNNCSFTLLLFTHLSSFTLFTPLSSQQHCASARCAVRVMGEAAEHYGFFGEEQEKSGGGEAVSVGDGREAWVFHVLPDGVDSSVWVAKRVPEGELAVVANQFTIRTGMDAECLAGEGEVAGDRGMMCGKHLYAAAVKAGLADELLAESGVPSHEIARLKNFDCLGCLNNHILNASESDKKFKNFRKHFDFAAVYGMNMEQFHPKGGDSSPIPYYMTLRMWRVYNLIAPSAGIKISTNALYYPFSVKPDAKVDR